MKQILFARCFRIAMFVGLILMLTACAGKQPYVIELMPSPAVYDDGVFDPFVYTGSVIDLPYDGVLYATDRLPAGGSDESRFYRNERSDFMRLGFARVDVAGEEISWDEARRISLAKDRLKKYTILVSDINEFGIFDRSAVPFIAPAQLGEDPHVAARAFADVVNAKLANSIRKDIYIYTHGYKVVFEDPILVASELWHFLGYDGVFIAYAWPATPSRWAYLRDIETAEGFARNLRILLEYLAEETDVERIHVLGYSAGTRLVARTFEQMALMNHHRKAEEIRNDLKIDQVILVGSDMDREILGAYLADGFLKVPRHVSIYISEKDQALALSRFLTSRERLGEVWAGGMGAVEAGYLYQNEADISVINVTEASQAAAGNGHGYFRTSPWASSDILTTLAYGLSPSQRGLVRKGDSPIWSFPADYIERLREAILNADPNLKKALENG